MNQQRIATIATHGVSFDLETHLGDPDQPGLKAPPVVVGSWAWRDPNTGHAVGELLRDPGAVNDDALRMVRERFRWMLARTDLVIVGANIVFDFLCMATDAALRGEDLFPQIFEAFVSERVFDVQIAEALHGVGTGFLEKDPRTNRPLVNPDTGKKGRYSLAAVVDLVLNRKDAKVNDYWRKRYALLEGIPVEQWPWEARQYPVDDAVNTLDAALAQVGAAPNVGPHRWRGGTCSQCSVRLEDAPEFCRSTWPRVNLAAHSLQLAKYWQLWLGAAWGNRTDRVKTELLNSAAEAGRAAGFPEFLRAGFVREDGGTMEAPVMRAVAVAYGATGTCKACAEYAATFGPGRVPSTGKSKSKKGRGCQVCSGTGLDLTTGAVPRTGPSKTNPHGEVQIGAAQLTDSGDEFLMDFAVWGEDKKVTGTYVPALRAGYDVPITHRPNPILVTLRNSYDGTAQTMPRQVGARLKRALIEYARNGAPYVSGVRDCITARPGWWIYSNDFKGGEMVTLAELCVMLVGYSRLGEALIAGLDIHSVLGATMMGVPFAEFEAMLRGERGPEAQKRAKAFRQAAKPGNFGLPGRMGAQKLAHTQRKQGPDTPWPDGPSDLDGLGTMGYRGLRFCLLVGGRQRCGGAGNMIYQWARRQCEPTCKYCVEVASWISDSWRKQYPEMGVYLDEVVPRLEAQGVVVHPHSGVVIGGQGGGTISNGMFQHWLAIITARASFRVALEQYVRRVVTVTKWPSKFEGQLSPLFGSRPTVAVHDELQGEAPIPYASEACERVNEIMTEEFKKACPVHEAACFANPALMESLYKEAEEVRDASGRLVPWRPDLVKLGIQVAA